MKKQEKKNPVNRILIIFNLLCLAVIAGYFSFLFIRKEVNQIKLDYNTARAYGIGTNSNTAIKYFRMHPHYGESYERIEELRLDYAKIVTQNRTYENSPADLVDFLPEIKPDMNYQEAVQLFSAHGIYVENGTADELSFCGLEMDVPLLVKSSDSENMRRFQISMKKDNYLFSDYVWEDIREILRGKYGEPVMDLEKRMYLLQNTIRTDTRKYTVHVLRYDSFCVIWIEAPLKMYKSTVHFSLFKGFRLVGAQLNYDRLYVVVGNDEEMNFYLHYCTGNDFGQRKEAQP